MDHVALLVGLGSIGKTHLSYLTKNYGIIHVIDNDQEVFKNSIPELSKIKCYTNIKEFLSRSVTPDLVVIANWGPDHLLFCILKVENLIGLSHELNLRRPFHKLSLFLVRKSKIIREDLFELFRS